MSQSLLIGTQKGVGKKQAGLTVHIQQLCTVLANSLRSVFTSNFASKDTLFSSPSKWC